MFGIFRNASRRKKIMAISLVIGVFMFSAAAATMFNYEGNTGAQVAEAASRVNRQVDDTQETFTDIKELIPEEQRLEAAPPGSYAGHPTAGERSPLDEHASTSPVQPPMPPHGDAGEPVNPDAGHTVTYGLTPASESDPDTPESLRENGDDQDGEDPKKMIPPTATFNQKAREIQGDRMLTQRQEAMDRIVDNWTPRYEAAKREHEELVARIEDTRELRPQYLQEQVDRIERQGNSRRREIMTQSLLSDTRACDRWHQKATDVEMRSAEALWKIEDMNTFILFYKNRSDFKAITQYDDLDVPLQVGLLLESSNAFETETAGLTKAMRSD